MNFRGRAKNPLYLGLAFAYMGGYKRSAAGGVASASVRLGAAPRRRPAEEIGASLAMALSA